MFSGWRLEDPRFGRGTTWARCADCCRIMWNAALRFTDGYRSEAKLFKRARVVTLASLGVTNKLPGLLRRPRLLMGWDTERLIAVNARAAAQQGPIEAACKRDGALAIVPSYEGLCRKPIFIEEDGPQLEVAIQANLSYGLPRRRRLIKKTKVDQHGRAFMSDVFLRRWRLMKKTKVDRNGNALNPAA